MAFWWQFLAKVGSQEHFLILITDLTLWSAVRGAVRGGNGHVIEDVEGGTGVNGQMGFLGTEEKDAAATRTGFHFQPEKNL
ncbi:hypothetical protein CFC21_064744 [Triticum aestivum]|uniref:Dirigent protein n=4 Tax=Triticum TaxID=4564 RepID=A0A341UWX3_WHEAT|nr:hypothetical protein TRIUR3_31962 [Triticum urartu]KAF7029542.1 hypothetical protein CFC21_041252 [Triticum aestivum]KAF7057483.1 hypothetical protein CFC21_064744 [Triticum aestivum]VAI14434.1 unnamed protein product [Triticum turgidum subsp. durum]